MAQEYTCRVCGKIENPSSFSDGGLKQIMLEQGYCFTCAFWAEHYENDKTRDNALVVDGTHYIIGRDNAPDCCRGFGGRLFEIEFNDGRRVMTRNLWCQGTITEEWRELFPDTARFI